MSRLKNSTSQRKKEHLEVCLSDDVAFKEKSSGFEHYEFKHYAITEVERAKINLSCSFFSKKISFPFLISCMTGGTSEAENINARLAEAANELNIPLGVGSQRQALESKNYHSSYKIIRKKAPNIPVLGNIGAAQAAKFKDVSPAKILVDLVEADALVIHVNPLQELLQNEGEPDFKGLLKSIERIV
jgi:isopentenyl-diphosphate delta-isomerase